MTLICSNFSPHAGLIATADILISAPSGSADVSVSLPLQPRPFSFSSGMHSLHGTAQKMVISNATMIQWAGNYAAARAFVQEILATTNEGTGEISKADALKRSALREGELKSVSLIYHFREGPHLRRWGHECQSTRGKDSELFISGTGSWDYLHNNEVNTGLPHYGPIYFTGEAIARAFRVFSSELLDRSNYAFHYGGWLEFATAGPNTFTKSPVAVKLWTITQSGELRSSDPLLFSTYNGFDLHVVRVASIKVGHKIQAKTDVFRVPDFIGRSSPQPELRDLQFKPTILCHHIFDERSGSIRQLFEFEWTQISMKVRVSEQGVDLAYSRSLADRLLGRSAGALTFSANIDIHGTSSSS